MASKKKEAQQIRKSATSRLDDLVTTAPTRLLQFGVPEVRVSKKQCATQLPTNEWRRLDSWAKSLGCRVSQLLAATVLDAMDKAGIEYQPEDDMSTYGGDRDRY